MTWDAGGRTLEASGELEDGSEMGRVALTGLRKAFGEVVALDDLSFSVESGECVALLGPSGCGKTTSLRLLAGFLQPDRGEIRLDSRIVSSPTVMVPPHQRGMAMVFQNYALWPDRTVFANVAYGLAVRRLAAREVQARVARVLELVQLPWAVERYPRELSGGQQQRVALARALVVEPSVLLLDEPLSNLDAQLRERMRFELTDLLRSLGITAIYVTHDQGEAMVVADRIVVMHRGKVEQVGSPRAIYARSRSQFVAGFVGSTNWIPGVIESARSDGGPSAVRTRDFGALLAWPPADEDRPTAVGEAVQLAIRPEDVEIAREGSGGDHGFAGRLERVTFLGPHLDCRVRVGGVVLRGTASPTLDIRAGDPVIVRFRPEGLHWVRGGA